MYRENAHHENYGELPSGAFRSTHGCQQRKKQAKRQRVYWLIDRHRPTTFANEQDGPCLGRSRADLETFLTAHIASSTWSTSADGRSPRGDDGGPSAAEDAASGIDAMTAVAPAGIRRRPRGTRGNAVANAAAEEAPARSGPAEFMAPGTCCCIEANRSAAP